MEKRVCSECGELIHGRTDKKFCSDLCRNAHNNKLNSDGNNFVRNVNNILRKNRRILLKLNPTGKARVHKDKLVEEGFNFNYYTNIYQTKKGTIYYFCYEYGYLVMDDNFYFLVVSSNENQAKKEE